MYIRKQNVYTEKKIYPYAKLEDLRADLLPKIRIMAQNHAGGTHPWTFMDDTEMLKSAGLSKMESDTALKESVLNKIEKFCSPESQKEIQIQIIKRQKIIRNLLCRLWQWA